MQTMQIEEARKQLGELVDQARLAGEPTLIMRYRKPAAILVPIDWYEEAAAALDSAGDGPASAHDPEEGP
jgi:PHD/YefM family antitoxin component YafN of YafNO toxin-antitoxin module